MRVSLLGRAQGSAHVFHWCVWIPRDPVERKQASSVTAPMYIGYQLVHSMVGCVQCMVLAGEGLQSRPRLTLRFRVLCSAVFLSVIVVALVVFLVVLILVKPLQASLASYTLTVGLALLPSVLVWLATRLWGMFLGSRTKLTLVLSTRSKQIPSIARSACVFMYRRTEVLARQRPRSRI